MTWSVPLVVVVVLGVSSRAAQVLRLAVDSALADYPRDATPWDLLRGLVREGRSPAARLLRANGITTDSA